MDQNEMFPSHCIIYGNSRIVDGLKKKKKQPNLLFFSRVLPTVRSDRKMLLKWCSGVELGANHFLYREHALMFTGKPQKVHWGTQSEQISSQLRCIH